MEEASVSLRTPSNIDPRGMMAATNSDSLPRGSSSHLPGPSILLRPWSETDAVALREAIDEDPGHLKPWLSWTLDEPTPVDRTRERLRSWVEQYGNGTALRFAIVPAVNPLHILGGGGLATRFGPGTLDIGYWLRRSATRQGIASAAISALVVRAFAVRGVERLILQCDDGNHRSAALARSLGFRLIGPATTEYPDGTPRPVLRFEMLRCAFDGEHGAEFGRRARQVRIAVEGE
jgi:RimJ/RimL family protein N-acetyltransferase